MEKKKQIVFLEATPQVMVYKMAKLLGENGYSVNSVLVLETKKESEKFYEQAFDKVIPLNLGFSKMTLKNIPSISMSLLKKAKALFRAVIQILRLKPCVVFARATPSWLCSFTKILFKKLKVVYFPYDIRSAKGSSKDFIQKTHKIPEFEFKSEKFGLEKSDGIVFTGGPEEITNLNEEVFGTNPKINSPLLNFHQYCSKEFIVPQNKNKISKKDKEIHTVYVGSIGSMGMRSDNYLLQYFNALVEQKIHVHIYASRSTVSESKFIDPSYKEGAKLLNSKYFHLHDPLSPHGIIKEISKYDFGLLLPSEPIPKDKPEMGGYSTSNKIASYLEAGIPLIYYDKYISIHDILKKYELDVRLGDIEDVVNLKKRLKKLNYKELERKVVEARKDFLMEKQFPRLEKFMKKVISKKKEYY
jgi:hypothetical protein